MNSKTDEKVAKIAAKLRKIRELKNLTREQFCERLGENVEYWGKIERGEIDLFGNDPKAKTLSNETKTNVH